MLVKPHMQGGGGGGYVPALISAAVATELTHYAGSSLPTVCSCSYPSSYPPIFPTSYPVIDFAFSSCPLCPTVFDSFLLSFLYHFYIFILSSTTSFRLIHTAHSSLSSDFSLLIHCSPVSCIFQLVSLSLSLSLSLLLLPSFWPLYSSFTLILSPYFFTFSFSSLHFSLILLQLRHFYIVLKAFKGQCHKISYQ